MRILACLALASASVAHAECPPEHAARGHCTPEPLDEPVVTATRQPTCTGEHAAMGHCTQDGTLEVTVGLRAIAATYTSPLFEGNYQGTEVMASVAWTRFAASLGIAGYRLERNGLASNGVGDAMVHLHATLFACDAVTAGAMLMASLPTGDDARGFGMGHVMLMPELWGAWNRGRVSIGATAGYSHAFGGAMAHAEHGGGGAWPLVDPMNARELVGDVHAMVTLVSSLRAGVDVRGAAPIGDGNARLVTGGVLHWSRGAIATTASLAGGVVGDPFGIRATLGVSLRVR